MAWTRARRRWAWALALVLAAFALAVPITVARRQEPTPRGTPVNVLLEDFRVRRDAVVVPAGTVSLRIRNQGPTTHELIVVRTDRAPDKLPLQDDGLTVDEEAPGIQPSRRGRGPRHRRPPNHGPGPGGRQLRHVLQPGRPLPGGCMRSSPPAEVGAASATQRTAAGGRSGIGRLVPRLPILGDLRLGRRLGWVIPVLIVLVAAIVVYNARALDQQRGSALIVNTAARQRALVERYDGRPAGGRRLQGRPRGERRGRARAGRCAAGRRQRARAPGRWREGRDPPARDRRVRLKLEQDRRLIDELIKTGDRLLDGGRKDPEYRTNVTQLRVLARGCRASPMTPPGRSPR